MIEREATSLNLPGDNMHRLNLYKSLLKLWMYRENQNLTIGMISEMLEIPANIILEDLSYCEEAPLSSESIIQTGSLIDCIDRILGSKPLTECLLIGVGKQGSALLRNETLTSRVKIVAAFEINQEITGKIISGLKVQHMNKLQVTVRQLHLKMALIATTTDSAPEVLEQVLETGIKVIWNFTQANLDEKPGIILQNTSRSVDIEADYLKILSRL
jgi:redox-sensing transcriptional repressor